MKKGSGWGGRLESRFQPALYWGAEFLSTKVRLLAFMEKEGMPEVMHTFEGDYAQAEVFAAKHGLEFDGIRGAVSHLPFKIEPLKLNAESNEEDLQPHIDRAKPLGLPSEAFDVQSFQWEDSSFLILCREEALQEFLTKLSPSLHALWSLEFPHLALLPFIDKSLAIGHWVSILCEEDFIHLLFFRESTPIAYAKMFTGWDDAHKDANAFATEIKKALVYHFESQFTGLSLQGVQIWREGPAGEVATALHGMGIAQFQPDWGALAKLPESMRVAGALALQGLQGKEAKFSFTHDQPADAFAKRLWNRRAGLLAKTEILVFAAAGIGVAMLILSALGLHLTVTSKAKSWSGELQRWTDFQKQKTDVDGQLESMKGLINHRTEGYSSLTQIAKQLPPEVWLESWEVENISGHRFSHHLDGYSLLEAHVPEFLANLEKTGLFNAVKLKTTERIKAESVEEKTKISANRKDLVRFQITATE